MVLTAKEKIYISPTVFIYTLEIRLSKNAYWNIDKTFRTSIAWWCFNDTGVQTVNNHTSFTSFSFHRKEYLGAFWWWWPSKTRNQWKVQFFYPKSDWSTVKIVPVGNGCCFVSRMMCQHTVQSYCESLDFTIEILGCVGSPWDKMNERKSVHATL